VISHNSDSVMCPSTLLVLLFNLHFGCNFKVLNTCVLDVKLGTTESRVLEKTVTQTILKLHNVVAMRAYYMSLE